MTGHFIPYKHCTSLNYVMHITVTAYVHRMRTFLRPFTYHWDALPMALCTGQSRSLESPKHDFRNTEHLKCNCICPLCGSTFSIAANESWAVHTEGFRAQNESTIRIREEISKWNGTQPFGMKTRSLGKQCKNFLNKPQIPSYMTSHPKRLCLERGLYSLPFCEYE
jgi:hypothetical protein